MHISTESVLLSLLYISEVIREYKIFDRKDAFKWVCVVVKIFFIALIDH